MSETNTTSAAAQSSGVELTRKGEAYCEAHRQEVIRREAAEIIEGCLDLVERMLRLIDQRDGDTDLEENGDDEPSLGGVGRMTSTGECVEDLESDNSDLEVSEPDTFFPNGSHLPGGGSGI